MTNVITAKTTRNFLKHNLKQLETADKTLLYRAANSYTNAKRTCGDVAAFGNALFGTLRQIEAKYNVAIFSPEETTLRTIDSIAEVVDIATNQINGCRTYFCSFKNVNEANAWLQNQKNIIVRGIKVVASCHFGVHVQEIRLEYTTSDKVVERRYCVREDSTVRAYVRSNPTKYCAKWERKNPAFKIEAYDKKGSAMSLFGGNVGFLRLIREKYMLLCSY